MANYHYNMLAIAANDENMCKILSRMGMNFSANKGYTHFNMNDIAELDTAEEIYNNLAPTLAGNYIFAFAGAPIPEDAASGSELGWNSSTSSEWFGGTQKQTIAQPGERFNKTTPEGTSVSFRATSTTGSAMSDSAMLMFDLYGDNWLLTVGYGTAWSPNSADLDVFFMGLPQGDYGIAFYDADEEDDYECISIFSGLHHGCAAMHAIEGECEWDTIERDDLKVSKRSRSRKYKSGLTDLKKLARIGAICNWSPWDLQY